MIQMDGGDRLRVTLLDRMSAVENGRSSVTRSLTLEDILMADIPTPPPPQTPPPQGPQPHLVPPSPARNHTNRSLLDVMRRERRDKTAWKSLRAKLRLKRTATTWISTNPIPTLDTPIPTPDNNIPRLNRLGFLLSNTEQTPEEANRNNQQSGDVVIEEGSEEREGRLRLGTVLAEERALLAREEVQPPRMSLMELLEDTEVQMYEVSERATEEEVEDGRDISGGGGGGGVAAVGEAELGCCVCMVRSKGAAFIPCGHTFCRVCSRELWVQRGNCPLCNTTILEILDIF